MKTLSRISPAEWHVMKAIWSGPPILARDVVEQLTATQKWHPKTVRTLLARLVKKRAVAFTRQGRAYRYRALVKEQESIKSECQVFLDRVFDGKVGRMISHLIRNHKLPAAELRELQRELRVK